MRGHVYLSTGSRVMFAMTAAMAAAAMALSGPASSAVATNQRALGPGSMSLVAGGTGGPSPAPNVALDYPCGVSYAAGDLYVGDGLVQEVNPHSGWLNWTVGALRRSSVISGTVLLGDGGPTRRAITSACGVAVDIAGNLVIADDTDYMVRVVAARSGTFYGQQMTKGDIYGVAGTGSGPQISGDGGPASQAGLAYPKDVAVDQAGNLVIADSGSSAPAIAAQLQVVAARTGTFYGQKMTAGNIYTVAGNASGLTASGDGGLAITAGLGETIGQVKIDEAGNLVIADTSGNTIRVVAVSNGTFYGRPMTAGHIYAVAGNGTAGFAGDGRLAAQAMLSGPLGVALDGAGNLLIADTVNNRVRVVAARTGNFYGQQMNAHDIYSIAGCGTSCGVGNGGPAGAARLVLPCALAVDGSGNLIVAEYGQMLAPSDRWVRVIAESAGYFYGQEMKAGYIYTAAGNGFLGLSGSGVLATRAVMIVTSARMVVDSHGNLLVSAGQNNRIRVVATSTGSFYRQQMTAGHIYTIAGGWCFPYCGNGGPALKAGMNFPDGVALDSHGNVVVADGGNNLIRVVAESDGTFYGQPMQAGYIYNVAGTGTAGYNGDGGPALKAELNTPGGLSVDGHGNLVITDENNNRIRVVAAASGTFYGHHMAAGRIYTVAGNGTAGYAGDGGLATQAELHSPKDVAIDGSGNLVITDQRNARMRVVAAADGNFYGQHMITGHIYTVAGNGTAGYAGDGGPATKAELNMPTDATVDGFGNLVIADEDNNRVRVVAATAGTFYGVPMTAGNIYTVAGNGVPGFSGQLGQADKSELLAPTGVAVNANGDLYIGDQYRVWRVTG
jgi:trimeric autotransporter adhesin